MGIQVMQESCNNEVWIVWFYFNEFNWLLTLNYTKRVIIPLLFFIRAIVTLQILLLYNLI